MFVHDNNQYKAQAEANLLIIEIHNLVGGRIANNNYRDEKSKTKSPEAPIAEIVGVLSQPLDVSINASWTSDEFPFKTTGTLKSIQDMIGGVTGQQTEAYKAGPFSSQKYKGVGNGLSYNLSFACHADGNEMLGFDSPKLSSPMEAFYWLTINQLPKEGRGLAGNIIDQIKGVADTVSQGYKDFVNWAAEKWANVPKSDSGGDFDTGLARINANPGNWINRITMGDYLCGWFVIKNMRAKFSKQRFHDKKPLYIDFDLSVENYMIPDKAAIMGSQGDIVSYKGEDSPTMIGIGKFSEMYIMNGGLATEQHGILKKGAEPG